MQKHDAQGSAPGGLERDIAQAQAEGLGVAGRKLQTSIERFHQAVSRRDAKAEHDALLSEVAYRAWALMVQRELIGFKHENLRWILKHFDVPDSVSIKLGHPAEHRSAVRGSTVMGWS